MVLRVLSESCQFRIRFHIAAGNMHFTHFHIISIILNPYVKAQIVGFFVFPGIIVLSCHGVAVRAEVAGRTPAKN